MWARVMSISRPAPSGLADRDDQAHRQRDGRAVLAREHRAVAVVQVAARAHHAARGRPGEAC